MIKVGLVSRSPRRLKILKELGFDVIVLKHSLNEDKEVTTEDPCKLTTNNALKKLSNVKPNYNVDYLIAIDTVVYINGKILSKPSNELKAFEYLKLLNGKCHEVYSGVALKDVKRGILVYGCESTKVCFDKVSDDVLKLYVKTGEPFDKAGAYAIQDLGKLLVKEIHGDFYNVTGFPLNTLKSLFKSLNFDLIKYVYEIKLKNRAT